MRILLIVCLLSFNSVYALKGKRNIIKANAIEKSLLIEFKQELNNKKLMSLKKKLFKLSGKSVPALIKVMKSKKYSDKNRWFATMSLAQIMGKKSSPFLASFLSHPSWVMRLASMKSLSALGEKKYSSNYAKALKDKSFIVRRQALETIARLKLTDKAPNVWAMLYDKANYYSTKKGRGVKRTNIIREAVKTVGDLKFQKAKKPLLTMIQKDKYKDIFDEMDYSLVMITGKKSPKGDRQSKKRYWRKVALMNKTIL